jgi:hypothetical protein
MSGHCFGKDWANLLSIDLWSTLQLKPLIGLHVSGFTFKPVGLILTQTYHVGVLADRLKHFVVFFQFLLLFQGEILFVRRLTLERQRVERVLRVLLVENVVLTIFPVGEVFLVRGLPYDWFFFSVSFFN